MISVTCGHASVRAGLSLRVSYFIQTELSYFIQTEQRDRLKIRHAGRLPRPPSLPRCPVYPASAVPPYGRGLSHNSDNSSLVPSVSCRRCSPNAPFAGSKC